MHRRDAEPNANDPDPTERFLHAAIRSFFRQHPDALRLIAGAVLAVAGGLVLAGILLALLIGRWIRGDGGPQQPGPAPVQTAREDDPAPSPEPVAPNPQNSGSDPPVPTTEPAAQVAQATQAIRVELSEPEIVLLNEGLLSAGDRVLFRVTAPDPDVRIKYRLDRGLWRVLEEDRIAVYAQAGQLRVEARSELPDDESIRSPKVVFQCHVRPANRPPTFSVSHTPDGSICEGETLTIVMACADPDPGDVAVVDYQVGEYGSWEPCPGGALTLSPPAGECVVRFRARDLAGLTSPPLLRRWQVLPRRNRSPEITVRSSPVADVMRVGDSLVIEPIVSDPDAGDICWAEVSINGSEFKELLGSALTLDRLTRGRLLIKLRGKDENGATSRDLVFDVDVRSHPVELRFDATDQPRVRPNPPEPSRPERPRNMLGNSHNPASGAFARSRRGYLREDYLRREENALRFGSSRFRSGW